MPNPLLAKVFQERPQTNTLGYYVGYLRYRRKDYRGAPQTFSAETSADPNVLELTSSTAAWPLESSGCRNKRHKPWKRRDECGQSLPLRDRLIA